MGVPSNQPNWTILVYPQKMTWGVGCPHFVEPNCWGDILVLKAHGDLGILQFRQPKLGCFDQVSTENEAWMGMKELHERIPSGDLT